MNSDLQKKIEYDPKKEDEKKKEEHKKKEPKTDEEKAKKKEHKKKKEKRSGSKGLYANLIKESEKTEYEYEDKNIVDNSKNGLNVNTVSSMFDLRNADSSINIYTFRLIDCSDAVERNKDFFEKNPGFRTDFRWK